uniref:RING-type E3 ubiquitin transferase n=1 Tax=Oncorhynchus tshawytscha TaxID=74940 RepID=A0AAZ3SAS6_ONCTS
MHGLCKEGINCRYSHDLNTSQPAAAMICKFFQKGNCVFGDRCRLASRPMRRTWSCRLPSSAVRTCSVACVWRWCLTRPTPVRDAYYPVQLLPLLLPQVHPQVEERQDVREQDHQVRK